MKPHIIKATTIIQRPIAEVFSFFSKAENLSLLTPPGMSFSIKTPLPIEMRKGTLIDYRIKVDGIPYSWRTEITLWEPPHRFLDIQLKGPYSQWEHEHQFRETAAGITEMTDIVKFKSPGGLLEPLIHHLYVKGKVEGIFRHRENKLKEIFK